MELNNRVLIGGQSRPVLDGGGTESVSFKRVWVVLMCKIRQSKYCIKTKSEMHVLS